MNNSNKHIKIKLILILIPCLLFLTAAIVLADENMEHDNIDNETYIEDTFIMEDMDVIETIGEGADSGVTEIPRDMIELIPSGNQGVTDILKIAPGVQFSEEYRGASSAGEISPGQISISGAAPYDNLFLLDGMSNSSLLDPASNNPNLASDVAGDPQKFFISQWLIDDVTLYDSDISAKYDGFQGGVVDVKTRKPGTKLGGNISYRGTNNYLTNFFLNDDAYNNFLNSDQSNQLYFEKHFLSAAVDIPINNKGGILLSYNRNWSKIPLMNFKNWKNQERVSESYYAKGLYNINSASYIESSFSYSPHNNKYFIKNTLNSDFNIKGGGYFGALNYVNETGGHKIKLHADYSYSENKKISPDDYKSWAATSFKPWGYDSSSTSEQPLSMEGGFGSIDKYEHQAKLNFDHNVKPLDFFGEHNISYGVAYSFGYGRYLRKNDAHVYKDAILSTGVICGGDFGTCVDGDQYFSSRYTTPASDVSAIINEVSGYIEEDYQIERVNLRAGLRVSYDDYMTNVNFSPRIRLSIDLLNNKNTIITGGYGRYYAASMMTYKLREGRAPSFYEERWTTKNELQNWQLSSDNVRSAYKFDNLKTPYNDEYTASINQKIFDSYINLKYVERHGKDGIATSRSVSSSDGISYYTFNNNGTSLYRSVQLKWSKSWKNHKLLANLTWSMSETSNDSYDDTFDIEEMEDIIYYNGKQIHLYELPKSNYARPVILNVAYVGRYFDHLKISVALNYKSPYVAIEQVEDKSYGYQEVDPVTGGLVSKTTSAYEDVQYGHNFTVDLGIYWEQPLWKNHKLTIFCEVYNLFNTKNIIGKRVYSSTSANDYELGTQLWLGANYEF